MFIITMPASYDVGQSLPCKINGRAERLPYKDQDTLIVEASAGRLAQTKAISWIEPAGKVGGRRRHVLVSRPGRRGHRADQSRHQTNVERQ